MSPMDSAAAGGTDPAAHAPPAVDDLYARLLAANADAFAGGAYEVAYHALAAALHRAADLGAVPLLGAVARLAEEQGAYIDTHAPEHTLSSQSAARHGQHTGIYATLASQATTRAHLVAFQHDHDHGQEPPAPVSLG